MLLRSLTSECYDSNVKIKLSSLIGVIENALTQFLEPKLGMKKLMANWETCDWISGRKLMVDNDF